MRNPDWLIIHFLPLERAVIKTERGWKLTKAEDKALKKLYQRAEFVQSKWISKP